MEGVNGKECVNTIALSGAIVVKIPHLLVLVLLSRFHWRAADRSWAIKDAEYSSRQRSILRLRAIIVRRKNEKGSKEEEHQMIGLSMSATCIWRHLCGSFEHSLSLGLPVSLIQQEAPSMIQNCS